MNVITRGKARLESKVVCVHDPCARLIYSENLSGDIPGHLSFLHRPTMASTQPNPQC